MSLNVTTVLINLSANAVELERALVTDDVVLRDVVGGTYVLLLLETAAVEFLLLLVDVELFLTVLLTVATVFTALLITEPMLFPVVFVVVLLVELVAGRLVDDVLYELFGAV